VRRADDGYRFVRHPADRFHSTNKVRIGWNDTWRGGAEPLADQEHHMNNLAKRFVDDESGATAIEYGLIAAGISVAIIAVVNSLGSQLKSTFTNISSQLATAGK
jgi:pilus assembly protein Flp/PilA